MRPRLLLPLLLVPALAAAQAVDPASVPPELRRFAAKGEAILDFEYADLNGDSLRDAVLIVQPAELRDDDEGVRTLKIAIRSPDGRLKVVKQSRSVAFCRSCGGVFGDPYEGLSASRNRFSVHHYGGSAWRWSNTATFAWSRRDMSWQLVQVDQVSFHVSEPEKVESKTFRPPRDFGKIDIADYDPGKFEGVGKK